MKKLFVFFPLLVIFAACSDEDAVSLQEPFNSIAAESTLGKLRTPEEALAIAENAIGMLSDAAPVSRSGIARRVDSKLPVGVLTTGSPASRSLKVSSRSGGADTLMYVVNYADSMGFAIVSAVRSTPGLIAVTVAGSYDPSTPSDNPGFDIYMDAATQYLAEHLDDDVDAPSGTIPPGGFPLTPMPLEKIDVDTIWHKRVPIRVKVYWGQISPEGDECPNKRSGCSITAMAMAMSYFKYPTSIKLSYNSAGETIALDWDKLTVHGSFIRHTGEDGRYARDICSQYDYPIHTRLAQLCRELGYRSKSEYKFGEELGTATSYTDVMNTLRNMGYGVRYKKYEFGSIQDDLNSGSILLMRGQNSEGVGHMWLCDAVESYHLRLTKYQAEPGIYVGEPKWWFVEQWHEGGWTYHFFNWGWGTSHNWDGTKATPKADRCGYFLELDYGKYGNDVGYIVVNK